MTKKTKGGGKKSIFCLASDISRGGVIVCEDPCPCLQGSVLQLSSAASVGTWQKRFLKRGEGDQGEERGQRPRAKEEGRACWS